MTAEFLAGVLLAAFLGFIANRMGYLSVHKKAEKPKGGSGGSGGGSTRPPNRRQIP